MSYIPHSANPTVAHYLSWFGDFDEKSFNNNDGISVYTKANINVDNFSLEKNKVLYLLDEIHDSEIPDNCALIKFSYNSEHNEPVLIEEENIAIVSDGREGNAIIDIVTSLKSYQFLCDENGIPFTDTCDVDLVVKQGNVKLKILSISVSSEDTDFKDGLYSCKIKNEQGVVVNGTEHDSINSQTATISLSVLRGEKQAKDRIVAKFTVTYEKDNEFIEEKKDIETLDYFFIISSVATGVYLGMMVSADTSNGYFSMLDDKGKLWVTGSEGKNINRGDYILWGGKSVNIENGEFVQGLVYTWNGIGWERDTNESHTINTFSDVINIAESLDDSSETVKVYKSLTTALLNVGRIFANNITLAEQFDKKGNSKKGIIKSANWESKVGGGDGRGTLNGDQTIANYSNVGWALDYNGKADFTNMNANGGTFTKITANGGSFENIDIIGTSTFGSDVIFQGNISSGPLLLKAGAVPSKIYVYPAGSVINATDLYPLHSVPECYIDIHHTIYPNVKGNIGDISFTKIILSKFSSPGAGGNEMFYVTLKLYNGSNLVFERELDRKKGEGYDHYIHFVIPADISYTYPDYKKGKILQFIDLPTYTPEGAGYVYVEDGFLKLS